MKGKKGKDNMKKRIRDFVTITLTTMLVTPLFTAPKLPVVPNITGSVTIPAGATEAAKKAGSEAVKNLKIDWSKFKFNFN